MSDLGLRRKDDGNARKTAREGGGHDRGANEPPCAHVVEWTSLVAFRLTVT